MWKMARTDAEGSMSGNRDEWALLDRITTVPGLLGGKPVIRGRRLAVEHVLGMLAVGDDVETILSGHPWLEPDDIRACVVFGEQIRNIQESVHAREWHDVEMLDSSVSDATVYEEWIQDAEPNYDSEEESRSAERSLILGVADHV